MSPLNCFLEITPQFPAVFQIPTKKDCRMKYSDLNYEKKVKKKSKFECRITAFANNLLERPNTRRR